MSNEMPITPLPGETVFVSPAASHDSAYLDPYARNPRYQELSTELRALLFAGAETAHPTRENSPESNIDSHLRRPGYKRLLEQLRNGSNSISMLQHTKYLRIWITECAPWLDMFDQARTFGLTVPLLAQKSPPVLYAMLALSARQMERHQSAVTASRDSLQLYSEAIGALSSALDAKDPCLVTACILCVLEMMSASPREWRRHLEGCAALFEASGVHGLSQGVPQAVFWCFARMDLCAAIISDCTASTVVPIHRWAVVITNQLGVGEAELIRQTFVDQAKTRPDMWANYMVYLCAKACDLVVNITRHNELGEENGCDAANLPAKWNALWEELQLWHKERPAEMFPMKCFVGPQEFPCAFYSHYAAISSNQLFHTACILMLEARPNRTSILREAMYTPLWHAKCIVGISLANPHRGCLNNAIQPLYVAGKLFSHREEHLVVIRLLDIIEAGSGWAARWRIKDLEAAWGYPAGTFLQKSNGAVLLPKEG